MTKRQRKECTKIIHISSVAAGGAGFFQIPFGDRKLITPIQVMMTMKLARVFDINLTESAAVEELLTCGLVSTLGRRVSGTVTSRSTISKKIVNMSMAAMVTETLGWIMVREFDRGEVVEQLLLVKSAVENDDNQSDSSIESYQEMIQSDAQCSQTKDKQSKNDLFYVLGSVVALGIACFVIPNFSEKTVNSAYKARVKRQNENED